MDAAAPLICSKCGGSLEREFAEVEGNTVCSACHIAAARLELKEGDPIPSYFEILESLRKPKKSSSKKNTEE